MLTDYLICYKLKNTSTSFLEVKYSPKLRDCQVCNLIKVLGYSKTGVHKFQKEEKVGFFYTCIPEKIIILVQRLHSIIRYMYVGVIRP